MQKHFFTVKEVAQAFDVSVRTVWRAVKDGRFPPPHKTTINGLHKRAISRWTYDAIKPFLVEAGKVIEDLELKC